MDFLSDITVTDISDVFTVFSKKGKHIKITNRKTYGLSFCVSGKITYKKGNIKVVSQPDCAIILPMNVSYELYNNIAGEFPLINFSTTNKITDDFIIIPISSYSNYIRDYEKLKKLQLMPKERLKMMNTFYEILDRLNCENQKNHKILNGVMQYINNNFCDYKINNKILAEKAKISEVYFRRIFKEDYNVTPKQYILQMRIELAKQLLIETEDTISNLSAQCGFLNIYHFCKLFKEKNGFDSHNIQKVL